VDGGGTEDGWEVRMDGVGGGREGRGLAALLHSSFAPNFCSWESYPELCAQHNDEVENPLMSARGCPRVFLFHDFHVLHIPLRGEGRKTRNNPNQIKPDSSCTSGNFRTDLQAQYYSINEAIAKNNFLIKHLAG